MTTEQKDLMEKATRQLESAYANLAFTVVSGPKVDGLHKACTDTYNALMYMRSRLQDED